MNEVFDYFKKIFNNNGFRLFMIGSSSRDYLLGKKILDYDFVTDATPEDTKKFLKCDHTFERYGSLKVKYNGYNVDIVTFRIEGSYKDYRHPSFIKFVKSIEEDYVRRDFTINSIYIDENYNILDPTNLGVSDLKNRILRLIGDKEQRLEEDPLRIIRGERFLKEYGLEYDEETKKAFDNKRYLIKKLNKSKVVEEISKGEKYEIWKFKCARF